MAKYGSTSETKMCYSHIDFRPLPPELAKIAREELNETPDRIQQDLLILRDWIRQQTHLRARTSDAFLIAFLRRCCYSLEETKKRIEKYFSFYTHFPEVFTNRCVNQCLLSINRLGVHYYPEIPKLNNHTALLIARFGTYCPRTYHIRDLLRFFSMAMEIIAMESDNAAVAGICEIIDLTGVSMERFQQVDKNIFKKWWEWLQDCCPLHIKEIYILNSPKEMQKWFSVMRALRLTHNYQFVFLKTVEELYPYIPRESLPEEYGGTNGHIIECTAYMEDLLRNYRDYFEEDVCYGTIEQLRSGEVVTYEAEFGAEGTFRKLEFE